MMAASQPEHEHQVSGTSGTSGTAPPRPAEPAPAPAHEPPAQRGRLRSRLGSLHGWAMAAAVMVVVAALAAVLLGRAGLLGALDGASGSWHTCHDPFGLFTLRVPPGWATHYAPTTGTFGDRYGSETERVDMVSFDNPAQGTGSAYVLVTAYPIKTAFDHEHNCQQPANNESFTPLTLRGMEPSGYRLFTTETAWFQVDVGIPGVVMLEQVGAPMQSGAATPTPTPLPAAWVATDKSVVNAMLVSLQPTDPKPLTC